MSEILNGGVHALSKIANEVEKALNHELRNKDAKYFFLNYLYFDSNIFEKITNKELTKRVWDSLKKCMVLMRY